MMRAIAFAVAAAATAAAQPTVAPTPEPSSRGQNVGAYNFVNSFETGYRFAEIGGNAGKYRSDVNFTSGVRLLGSHLAIHSREGRGRFFDQLLLTTQGLGNDPYESASLRIEKNRFYRFDSLWRQNEYFNPALAISSGRHAMNTLRRFQDYDLTLLPQSNFKFFFGYTRNSQSGAALTTIQLFDSRGDEFPLFSNIRRQRNEYRFGSEIKAFGYRLNWMHGWDNFKEDTPANLLTPDPGANTADRITLDSLRRAEPYHGNSPYWRLALFRENQKLYAVNARFTYTAGRRAFVLDEFAAGAARFGASNRQVLTFGDANRPVATGNLTISLFPSANLTLTNHSAIYNVRTDGNSYYRTLDNGTLSSEFLNFQYLGIRTVSNQTEVNYRVGPTLAAFAGYNYSNRRIRSIERLGFVDGGPPDLTDSAQTNQLNSGTVGVRLRPIPPLVIVVDAELGRAGRPLYPTSERNYHLIGARAQYRTRTVTFTAQARANYNFNSTSLTSFSSQSRNYSADLSWTARDWVSLDLSYAKLHLYTVGGIAYFASGSFVPFDRSYYFSNIHHGNLGARFNLRSRADLFIGFSHIQDTGANRRAAAIDAFRTAQTFPLTFQSPLARVSVRLHEKVRLNVGYQYYGYREDFSLSGQGYRANTGYSSLLWSF